MVNFDLFLEKATDKYLNDELTIEQLNDIIDAGYDKYVLEGANLDIRAKLKDMQKEYKPMIQELRKAVKDCDAAKVEKIGKDLLKVIDHCENEINTIDAGDFGSIVFSWYTSWTITWARDLLLSLVPIAGTAIASALNIIENFEKPVRNAIDGDIKAEDFNLYKNKAIAKVKKIRKIVEKEMSKCVKEIKEEEKKA